MTAGRQGESESQTRRRRIDPRLVAQGWDVIPYDEAAPLAGYAHHAIEEHPTANGPADYALCHDGRLVGVVEAKRVSLGPQEVLTQAERYARGLAGGAFNFRGLRVPFLYSTNGEVIWFHDVRHDQSRSRKVAQFHTPAALAEMLARDAAAEIAALQAMPNDHPRLRPYQIEANIALERAVADRKRHMLLAMATGTGKTFTMVNQVYRLMKSGVARRILFLVDRRALAAQAVRSFASFEPEPGLKFTNIYEVYSQRFKREDYGDDDPFDPSVLPANYLLDPTPGLAFVYVCTIQRMAINLLGRDAAIAADMEELDDDAARLDMPIHAFDAIIADECHRGYTSSEQAVWRSTLEHFDAIKIGLTATPAAHTTSYFSEVVYRYEYERAVREGFLVDYDAVKISSDVRQNGMFLNEGEHVELIDTESGSSQLDLLEDEREFKPTEVERKVTSPDSNRKIVDEIKKYALEHEQECGRFPKTLIFAANDLPHASHADQLVDYCRDAFGRGDAFVTKITGSPTVDRPLQRIREFRNRPNPGVVVSVDLMSTGVDIPDLEFIVFLRQVKSRILFEQMLGRGTRKGEKFPDKSHFVVFDCFDGSLLEYFKNASAMTVDGPRTPGRSIVEVIADIWENRDRPYNTRVLVKRLQRIDKEMPGEAREMFAAFIPDGDLGRYAAGLPAALQRNFTETMALLRNPAFQDLLINYPRARRPFMVASEHVDTVSSEWLIRDGVGNEYRPEDYLAAFSRFVEEHADQVDAIAILLSRPRDWSTAALTELRDTLTRAREHFTVENLQRAHQARYRKALVDIISMVKHAADEQAALLTAEERVDQAIGQVTAGRDFTPEQQAWLDRIRSHLIENLSIDGEDFEDLPVFSREGGWGRANAAFDGSLGEVLKMLNEGIAA